MYWNTDPRPIRRIPVRSAAPEGVSAHANGRSQIAQSNSTQATVPKTSAVNDAGAAPAAAETDWQEVALRLQAEMDNFRQRQTRRAEEAAAVERERLLHLMLPVADNLARALNYDQADPEKLRQGIELTRRELMRRLEAEGVTRLESVGQPFTPDLHEALATTPAGAEPGTVVEEIEAGYKLGDKLLRPARVVVAA